MQRTHVVAKNVLRAELVVGELAAVKAEGLDTAPANRAGR